MLTPITPDIKIVNITGFNRDDITKSNYWAISA